MILGNMFDKMYFRSYDLSFLIASVDAVPLM